MMHPAMLLDPGAELVEPVNLLPSGQDITISTVNKISLDQKIRPAFSNVHAVNSINWF